jgi:uncharacterized phage-associated protein
MSETIHARKVADYFLANVDEDSGDSISNLKLQKLVYYAQGLHMGMRDSPLFGEPIEAWDHGPVVPGLYHDFKHRGHQGIAPPEQFSAEDYLPEVREILDAVLSVYGQFSAWKLRDLTHEEPPWRETPWNGNIAQSSLRAFFVQVVDAGREGRAYAGEPVWPTNSFKHQQRTEIMKLSPGRDRVRAALSRVARATEDITGQA